MVIAGPNYECLYADVGTNVIVNDGGAWNESEISTSIESNEIELAPSYELPGSSRLGEVTFLFLADEPYHLKSCPSHNLTLRK